MSSEQHLHNLLKLLVDDINEVAVKIENAQQLGNKEIEDLIIIYQSQGKFLAFVQNLLENEINSTISNDTLFRRNSVAMKMTSIFIKNEAFDFTITLLQDILQDMTSKDQDYEIDEAKIENKDDIEENGKQLIEISTKILDKLFSTKDQIPYSIRKLLSILRKYTEEKFEGKGLQSVASLLFLRLINPAIVAPVEFGLTFKEHPNKNMTRGLILITKILQNIANKTTSSKKELYMKPIEPFIERMIDPTYNFLTYISEDIDFDLSKNIKKDVLLETLESLFEYLKQFPLSDKIRDEVNMIGLVEELKKVLATPKLMNLFLQYSSKIGKQGSYLMLVSIHQFTNGDDNIEVDKIISRLKKDFKIENYKMNQLEFFMDEPHKSMFDDILPELIIDSKFKEFLESKELKDELTKEDKKEEIKDIKDPPTALSSSPISKVLGYFEKKHKKCTVCNDRVYLIDTITIEDKNYHKKCFKCFKCKNALNTSNYKLVNGNLLCMIDYQNEITSPRKMDGFKSFKTTNPKCAHCNQVVYFKERLEVDNQVFHKETCFKCNKCKAPLNVGNYKSFKGVIYCQIHYRDVVK